MGKKVIRPDFLFGVQSFHQALEGSCNPGKTGATFLIAKS